MQVTGRAKAPVLSEAGSSEDGGSSGPSAGPSPASEGLESPHPLPEKNRNSWAGPGHPDAEASVKQKKQKAFASLF